MKVDPARRNPLFVAVQADFCVEALVNDLSRNQLRLQRLPSIALRKLADLAIESLIAEQEPLGEVAQRLPQLTLDAGRAIAVLQILRGQRFAQRLGLDIQIEDCLQPGGRTPRVPLGKRTKLDQERRVRGQRIARRECRKPALSRLCVRERVLLGLAETEH